LFLPAVCAKQSGGVRVSSRRWASGFGIVAAIGSVPGAHIQCGKRVEIEEVTVLKIEERWAKENQPRVLLYCN
jgi:hypothetical protein